MTEAHEQFHRDQLNDVHFSEKQKFLINSFLCIIRSDETVQLWLTIFNSHSNSLHLQRHKRFEVSWCMFV